MKHQNANRFLGLLFRKSVRSYYMIITFKRSMLIMIKMQNDIDMKNSYGIHQTCLNFNACFFVTSNCILAKYKFY